MIISASRRTDIPAFYAEWLMNRIRAGYCIVPNPFNSRQVRRVSLSPADARVIVFWTKNAAPLLPHLDELDRRGFGYYFQYTLTGYGSDIEPNAPSVEDAVATFQTLAELLGPDKVIWRYDPILLGNRTPPDYHVSRFSQLASMLRGATRRVMVSLADFYWKTSRRLSELEGLGYTFELASGDEAHVRELLRELALIARNNGMETFSCAETLDYGDVGVLPGRCVDGELIHEVFGIDGRAVKDPGQRKACGCVVSRDIGMVDTCLHGCLYCYATASHEVARRRHAEHDPAGEALITRAERSSLSSC